jgi:hypothetical protein
MRMLEALVPTRDRDEQQEVQYNIQHHPVLRILSGNKRSSAALNLLRETKEEAAAAAAAEAAAVAAALEKAKKDVQSPVTLEVLAEALSRKSETAAASLQARDDEDENQESW